MAGETLSSREIIRSSNIGDFDNFDLTENSQVRHYQRELNSGELRLSPIMAEALGIDTNADGIHLPDSIANNTTSMFYQTTNAVGPVPYEDDLYGRVTSNFMWQTEYLDYDNQSYERAILTGLLSDMEDRRKAKHYYNENHCERCGSALTFLDKKFGYGLCHQCNVETEGYREGMTLIQFCQNLLNSRYDMKSSYLMNVSTVGNYQFS